MIFLIHLLRKNETFIKKVCDENYTGKKLYANPREHSRGGSYSMLTGGGFASEEKSKYLFNLGIFGFGYFISSYAHKRKVRIVDIVVLNKTKIIFSEANVLFHDSTRHIAMLDASEYSGFPIFQTSL